MDPVKLWQLMLSLLLLAPPVCAKDLGQWGKNDPVIRQWYRDLMRPDNPTVSCCGEADAYWCDDVRVRNGRTYCRITDTRPNELLGRRPVDVGTELYIPDRAIKWDEGNPTGHVIVFLVHGLGGFKAVVCFVQVTGA
jgi:hypothetical protein